MMMIAVALMLAAATSPAPPPPQPPGRVSAAVQAPKSPAAPTGAYAVVQGQHAPDTAPLQTLTVICPGGRKAFGVGYTALVAGPPNAAGKPTLVERTLSTVSHLPEGDGQGWRVSASVADSRPAGAPAPAWSLVVRLVCYAVPR